MSNDHFILIGPIQSLLLSDAYWREEPENAVRALLAWRFDLTRHEVRVLEHLTQGLSDMEIATQFRMAGLNTVKKTVRTVLSKLGVSNRTQAAVLATRFGLGTISNPRGHPNG